MVVASRTLVASAARASGHSSASTVRTGQRTVACHLMSALPGSRARRHAAHADPALRAASARQGRGTMVSCARRSYDPFRFSRGAMQPSAQRRVRSRKCALRASSAQMPRQSCFAHLVSGARLGATLRATVRKTSLASDLLMIAAREVPRRATARPHAGSSSSGCSLDSRPSSG